MSVVLTEAAALDLVTDDEPRADGPRPAPALCPNCGEPRAGRFCAECGQREMGGRLTLRGLWREFASRVFNLDRGLLHTVASLARSPGSVPRDYVEGRRRTYTNPLSFFLLAATLSLFSHGLYGDALLDQAMAADSSFSEGFADGQALANAAAPDTTPPSEPDHDMTPEQAEREARMDAAVEEVFGGGGQTALRVWYEGMIRYNTPLTLLLALFLVAPLRVLFGSTRNVAEVSVFALYVVGLATALLAVLSPPLVVGLGDAGSTALLVATLVVYFGLSAWGAAAFYPSESTVGAVARGGAAMAVAYGAYIAAVMVFGGLYLFTHVLTLAGETWGSLLGAIFS